MTQIIVAAPSIRKYTTTARGYVSTAELLIKKQNKFIGPMLHTAITQGTAIYCPGQTQFCEKVCYADKGNGNSARSIASRRRTYECSLTDQFVPWMRQELRTFKRRDALRIHTAGEFYNVAYTKKWYTLVSEFPNMRFWTYTRSWRVPEILEQLLRLAALPNFRMFWSTDHETYDIDGPPPVVPGVGVAHLVSTFDEHIPEDVTLTWLHGIAIARRICVNLPCSRDMQGTAQHHKTCKTCQRCYNEKPLTAAELSRSPLGLQ